jgi:hypothetical protein
MLKLNSAGQDYKRLGTFFWDSTFNLILLIDDLRAVPLSATAFHLHHHVYFFLGIELGIYLLEVFPASGENFEGYGEILSVFT